MLAGTYTSGGSEGIYVCKFNPANGKIVKVDSIKTSNPSYLSVSPDDKFVYAVNEDGKDDNGGAVTAFSFDKKAGKLKMLNSQLSGGDHPCFVETDNSGRWVVVGNYSSGTLSVLPVKDDGRLGEKIQTIKHEGSGPDAKRQDKPHVHCTRFSPDNKWLLVADLGIDKIMIYSFDSKNGRLTKSEQEFAASDPGSGPRHITFHPSGKYAYLIEEMSGTVVTLKYNEGRLERMQRVSLLPDGFSGRIGAADIHISPEGKFLYASNRGDANDISVFRIEENGELRFSSRHSVMGKGPRNFTIDPTGRFLLVANQQSDEIIVFKIKKEDGSLIPTDNSLPMDSPVFVYLVS